MSLQLIYMTVLSCGSWGVGVEYIVLIILYPCNKSEFRKCKATFVLYRDEFALDLPEAGQYATGIFFLDKDTQEKYRYV